MRDRGKKKEGQRNVLPPQIFNGDDYIGVSGKKWEMHRGERKVTLVREKSYIGVREKKVRLQCIWEKEKLDWCEREKFTLR